MLLSDWPIVTVQPKNENEAVARDCYAVELMFGEAEKLVLGFCEAEKLSIWPLMMCKVAG